jgi:flagellar export protein FliJ
VAYRFTLDALLRLQRSLEMQQEQRLLAIAGVVTSIGNQIDALDAQRHRRKRDALSRIETGGSAAELHFAAVVDQLALEKRNELLEELRKAEELKKKQTALYHEVHRRTETLASLDAEQRREYNCVVSRREQQSADELFLIRRSFELED